MAETLKSLSEIKQDIAKAARRLSPLYEKFRENYEILSATPFTLPATEGKLLAMTSPEFMMHAKKVHGLLGHGIPSFSFKLDNETYKTRVEKLSKTERFVYAVLGKASKRLLQTAQNSTIHSTASFFITHFGGCIPRVTVWEDADKNPVFDVIFFQPWNTTWQYGADGLEWLCHKWDASPLEVEALYPKAQINESAEFITINDYWTNEWNGVFINDEWAEEPYEHKLKRIPVNIFTTGNMPLLQFSDGGREVIHKWYSAYDGQRLLIEPRNRTLSYRLTLAKKEALRPIVFKYDSTKGGSVKKVEDSPDIAGSVTQIDVGLGEAVEPSDPVELGRTTEAMESQLSGLMSMGGLSQIAYGVNPGTSTATGIAMLLEANSSYLNPFIECLEATEQWIAQELIRQTKLGKYKKLELDGADAKSKPFSLSITPSELEDEKEITCKVEMRSDVQLLQKAGLLVQLHDKEIISTQTTQDNLGGLVQDTDAEQERIAQELLRKNYPVINLILALNALLEDRKGSGDEDLKEILLGLIAQAKAQALPQKTPQPTPTGAPLPGQGGVPTPEQAFSAAQPQIRVPPEVSNAVRRENLTSPQQGVS